MAGPTFDPQAFGAQVAQTFGLNPAGFASQITPGMTDAQIYDLGQNQATTYNPPSLQQEAANWGVTQQIAQAGGYDPVLGGNASNGPLSAPGAVSSIASNLSATGQNGSAPVSASGLFSGPLINLVFIIVGLALFVIGGFMMTQRSA